VSKKITLEFDDFKCIFQLNDLHSAIDHLDTARQSGAIPAGIDNAISEVVDEFYSSRKSIYDSLRSYARRDKASRGGLKKAREKQHLALPTNRSRDRKICTKALQLASQHHPRELAGRLVMHHKELTEGISVRHVRRVLKQIRPLLKKRWTSAKAMSV